MVLRPGVGGIPGLFDGAQKKVAVPLKFRGRKAVVGLHAWVLGWRWKKYNSENVVGTVSA